MSNTASETQQRRGRLPQLIHEYQADFGAEWPDAGRRIVTLRADGEQWSSLVLDVALQAGLDVVLPVDVIDVPNDNAQQGATPAQLITINLGEVPAMEALYVLGEVRGLEPIVEAGVVRFRAKTASGMRVVDAGFIEPNEALKAVRLAVGSEAAAELVGQEIIVAGDREAVKRAASAHEAFAVTQPDQLMVSVWVIEMSDQMREDFGMALTASTVLEGFVGGPAASILAEGLLADVLRWGSAEVGFGANVSADGVWERNERQSKLLTKSSLVLVEGNEAVMDAVESFPVIERITSPQGTVTQSGVFFIEAGIRMSVTGRAVPSGWYLEIAPEISSITGLVDGVPKVDRRSMQVSCIVESGDWVVLAGLDAWREIDERRGIFGLGRSDDDGYASVVVVLHAQRVGLGRSGPAYRRPKITVMPDPMNPGDELVIVNDEGSAGH